ncbi:MAG: DUF99 family protein [Myxococcota bacterium]
MSRALSNCIGFDDGPFPRTHRGDVLLVGAVFARTRLDGVLTGRIRKDGANATQRMVQMVADSQFTGHVRAVLMKGIAVGGFNVVDIHALHEALGAPVLVVARKAPDLAAMQRALRRVPGAARKWRLIERAGAMEPLGRLWVQRAGLSMAQARDLVEATRLHGHLPEPLRVAHLIAGGMVSGVSGGRA